MTTTATPPAQQFRPYHGQYRDAMVHLRLTLAERKMIERAAAARGIRASDIIREAIGMYFLAADADPQTPYDSAASAIREHSQQKAQGRR